MNKNNSNSKNRELAYNGIGSGGGGGGGSVGVKSFTFTATGADGAVITIPDDATVIICLRGVKLDGGEVNYMGFPVVDGIGSCAGAYNIGHGYGGLTIAYTINGRELVITGGADIGAKLYDNGQVTTFYYI